MYASRPPVKSSLLIARAFGSRFRLLHLFRHLRFDRVKIEARAPLHRRKLDEGLDCLAHDLLDEYEAPELKLEPIEILLRAFLRPVVWPTCALERIQPQISDVRHIGLCLFTQPASGLVDEAELIVVDAYRADRAFTEVEDFVTRRTDLCR